METGSISTTRVGNVYIDGSGGALVVNIGHGRKEILKAMAEQMSSVGYVHGTQFTTKSVEDYAEALGKILPEGLGKIYFLSGGSEAIETAVKFARQYFLDSANRNGGERNEMAKLPREYARGTLPHREDWGEKAISSSVDQLSSCSAPLLLSVSVQSVVPTLRSGMCQSPRTAHPNGRSGDHFSRPLRSCQRCHARSGRASERIPPYDSRNLQTGPESFSSMMK